MPESSDFAGHYGDGLITTGGEQPAHYQQMLAAFERGARSAGKDPDQMPRLIELNVAYTDDERGAIECQQKYWAGTFIPALFDQKIYTPAMAAKNGAAVGADTIKQKSCISADPKTHVTFAMRYIELGFTTLFFHSAGPDQRAFLEGYGRDVLPRIRRAAEQRAAEPSRRKSRGQEQEQQGRQLAGTSVP